MSASIAAQMLSSARQLFAGELGERVRERIEALAAHVEALNAFPLPDESPPYFPSADPLPSQPTILNSPAPHTQAPAASGSLHSLSAVEIAALVATRQVSAEEIARATLDRIAATEARLQAWVWVDREQVLADARKLDALPAAWPRGSLHGVPVGVKDIYDVAGMPTRAGSRVLAHAPAAKQDSWLVARLRAAGALIVGKTATTEFAYADPAGTRNPWNLAHTPGGSSSGSAAAVAARVVPLALGTQTAGSVIRPASFCGVVGYKPSWGRVPLDGVVPFAWSLDTAGWLTRSVADAALVWHAIGGDSVPANGDVESARPRLIYSAIPFDAKYAPRSGEFFPSSTRRSLKQVSTGEIISTWPEATQLPQRVELLARGTDSAVFTHFDPRVHNVQQVVMSAEVAEYHRRRYLYSREGYGPIISSGIAAGLTLPAHTYLRALRVRRSLRESVMQLLEWKVRTFIGEPIHPADEFNPWDALVLAAAPGAAPEGLDFTGDPSFNAPWTQFGFPAITLFGGTDAAGLPLGVQLVGRPGMDGDLLRIAAWCENVLGKAPAPPAYA